MFISDKAHFHLSGHVNNKNNRDLSDTDCHELHEVPLHTVKGAVWCAILSLRIMGPCFFESNKGNALTVTVGHFVHMIENIFTVLLTAYPEVSEKTRFQ
jgi:hypothetical protein